jgi:tyrosyl-tRNA synthetase
MQISLVDVLVESGLVSSKTEARTMIKQNAISVNGEKVTDENYIVMSLSIIKRGKNKFALVK